MDHGFLLVFRCNYIFILHRFQEIALISENLKSRVSLNTSCLGSFTVRRLVVTIYQPSIQRVQALADISRSALLTYATKPCTDCKSAQ